MPTATLSWTDNAANEFHFLIYKSTATNPAFPGDYTQIDEIPRDVTTYEDEYSGHTWYAVTAVNAAGESVQTEERIASFAPSTDALTATTTEPTTTVTETSFSVPEISLSALTASPSLAGATYRSISRFLTGSLDNSRDLTWQAVNEETLVMGDPE